MRKILTILLLAIIAMGCSSSRDLSVNSFSFSDDPTQIEIDNTGVTLSFKANVRSGFRSKIVVRSADFVLEVGGRKVARVETLDRIVILPRGDHDIVVPLRIRVGQSSLLGLFGTLSGGVGDVVVRGEARVRKGLLWKKIKIEQVVTSEELRRSIEVGRLFL